MATAFGQASSGYGRLVGPMLFLLALLVRFGVVDARAFQHVRIFEIARAAMHTVGRSRLVVFSRTNRTFV